MLTLNAVLFVDDTDRFHMGKNYQTAEEFAPQIQAAITFWGMIVLATGGYLKQSKCQVGLVIFKFVDTAEGPMHTTYSTDRALAAS